MGGQVDSAVVLPRVAGAVEVAGHEGAVFHELRHYYASLLVRHGVGESRSRPGSAMPLRGSRDAGHVLATFGPIARTGGDWLSMRSSRFLRTTCEPGRLRRPLTQVRPGVVDETACKPGSVPGSPCGTSRVTAIHLGLPLPAGSSGLPAGSGGPPSNACAGPPAEAAEPFLTLLRVGFAEPPRSPGTLVRSYRTVSPLPALADRRSSLCGTVPRVTPGRCCRPPCPVEPGLSSPGSPPPRPSSRLVRHPG